MLFPKLFRYFIKSKNMANNIPNIPNNVWTQFEVQEWSIRTLSKVLMIHIHKHFNTLQERLAIEDYMVEKIRSFVTLLVSFHI